MVDVEEIWSRIAQPALSKKVLKIDQAGLYTFRITEGKNIYGETIYTLQIINILGFMDTFCEDYSSTFKNKNNVFTSLDTCKEIAKAEYKRLKEKQERRIKDGKM